MKQVRSIYAIIILALLMLSCRDKGAELRDFYLAQDRDSELVGKWIYLPTNYKDNKMSYKEFLADGTLVNYPLVYWYTKKTIISPDSCVNLLYTMMYGGNPIKESYREFPKERYFIKGDTLTIIYSNTPDGSSKLIRYSERNIEVWDSINQTLPEIPNHVQN